MAGRLDEVEQLLRKSLVGDGPGCKSSQFVLHGLDTPVVINKSETHRRLYLRPFLMFYAGSRLRITAVAISDFWRDAVES